MNFEMLAHLIHKVPCQYSNGLLWISGDSLFFIINTKILLSYASIWLTPFITILNFFWIYALVLCCNRLVSQNGYEILLQVFPHLLQLHKRVISGHPQYTLSLEPSNDAKSLLQKVFCWGIYCCYEDTTRTVDVSSHFFLDSDSQGILEISKSNNSRKVTNTQSKKYYICFAKSF